MPRDILFRGFHEEENGSTTIYVDGRVVVGYWVKGWLATVTTRISHINVFESDDGNDLRVTTYPVITSTVGQDTGVDEIDGMGIYEGDRCKLIKDERCIRGDIKFQNGSFYFKENCGEMLINLSDLAYNNYRIEVIGTIFDNEVTKCD